MAADLKDHTTEGAVEELLQFSLVMLAEITANSFN